MAEKETKTSSGEIKAEEEINEENAAAAPPAPAPQPLLQKGSDSGGGGGGGWGGWGFSPFSYLSDLQKAAAVAAEEISRNVCTLFCLNFVFIFRNRIKACLVAGID